MKQHKKSKNKKKNKLNKLPITPLSIILENEDSMIKKIDEIKVESVLSFTTVAPIVNEVITSVMENLENQVKDDVESTVEEVSLKAKETVASVVGDSQIEEASSIINDMSSQIEEISSVINDVSSTIEASSQIEATVASIVENITLQIEENLNSAINECVVSQTTIRLLAQKNNDLIESVQEIRTVQEIIDTITNIENIENITQKIEETIRKENEAPQSKNCLLVFLSLFKK
jgi:hypothetical protein